MSIFLKSKHLAKLPSFFSKYSSCFMFKINFTSSCKFLAH